MRTFGVTEHGNGVADLDGFVVDGIESLRQRVVQRLRFGRGTWALDPSAGTDRVIGHQITAPLAEAVITQAIRDEGGDEITDIRDIVSRIDPETRLLRYSATVVTIYGDLPITA